MNNQLPTRFDSVIILDFQLALNNGRHYIAGKLSIRKVDDRFVMSGGKHGEHSICATSTDDRIRAHWNGYRDNQK